MLELISIRPRGAFSYGLTVPALSLDRRGLVLLQGPNGAGKSSFFNALTETLWGDNDTGYHGDDIINEALGEGLNIEVVFKSSNKTYRVNYCRKFKEEGSARVSDVFLFDETDGKSIDLRQESMAQTRALLVSLLGMSYSQFLATSYMATRQSSKFLDGTDKERMQIITPFLGLEVWDKVQLALRDKLNKAARDLSLMEGEKVAIQRSLDDAVSKILTDVRIQELNALVNSTKVEIQTNNNRISEVNSSISSAKQELDIVEKSLLEKTSATRTQQVEITNLTAKMNKDIGDVQKTLIEPLKEDADLINILESEKSKLQTDLQIEINNSRNEVLNLDMRKDARFEAVHQALLVARLNLDQANRANKNISTGECPHCYSMVTPEHLSEVTSKINTQIAAQQAIIEAVEKEVEVVQSTIKEEHSEIAENNNKKIIDLRNGFDSRVKAIDAQVASTRTKILESVLEWRKQKTQEISAYYTEKIEQVKNQLLVLETDVNTLTDKYNSMKSDSSLANMTTELTLLESKVKQKQQELEDFQKTLVVSGQWKEKSQSLAQDLQKVENSIVGQKQHMKDLDFLVYHTGDKGIKRFKLHNCLGFMNSRMSNYMSILSNGMQVWFQDRKLKKTARNKAQDKLTDDDYINEFELFVSQGEKRNVPVGMYSGGERTLIALALQGVLFETANQFGMSGSNVLLVDEPFRFLNQDNRDRALGIIEYWKSLGKTLIVTDNTNTCDQINADGYWFVKKEGDISTIEVKGLTGEVFNSKVGSGGGRAIALAESGFIQ